MEKGPLCGNAGSAFRPAVTRHQGGTNDHRAIGFDADDTLWQNETYFRLTQGRVSPSCWPTMPNPIICMTGCWTPSGAIWGTMALA